MRCRTLSSIPGLHPLDTSVISTPPPHARMSLDIAKGPPEGEGQNHPGLRILDCSLQGRDDPKT